MASVLDPATRRRRADGLSRFAPSGTRIPGRDPPAAKRSAPWRGFARWSPACSA